MLCVPRGAEEGFVRNFRIELWTSGSDNLADTGALAVVRGVAFAQLLRPSDFLLIAMRNDGLPDLAVWLDKVDRAPIRHLLDRQLRYEAEPVRGAEQEPAQVGHPQIGVVLVSMT